MDALVSVIVPVYNAEPYLRDCLDSIRAQTYQHLEILLVDDGSTDGSGKICDEYAHIDSHIRVIHKKNGGVSSARNLGIQCSKGEYIAFVDSDDVLAPEYFQFLIEPYSDENMDLVICNVCDVQINGEYIKKENRIIRQGNLSGDFYKDYYYLSAAGLLAYVHCRLFRKDIIEKYKITFCKKLSVSEDRVFNFNYYRYVHKYVCVSQPLYFYYHRNEMSLTKSLTIKDFDSDLYGIRAMKHFLQSCDIENDSLILNVNTIGIFRKYGIVRGFHAHVKRGKLLRKYLSQTCEVDNAKQKIIYYGMKYQLFTLTFCYYFLRYIMVKLSLINR